ncbi:unnamed protein product [Penicillium palitans]
MPRNRLGSSTLMRASVSQASSLIPTNIRRAFSSTARALFEFIWEGTKSHPEYEDLLKEKMKKNRKLSGADKVEFAFVTPKVLSNA